MRQIVGFMAMTLDGFIADKNGGLAFLDPYAAQDTGYASFIATIGTVIMGRETYEIVLRHPPWPYAEKRVFIVTSRPLPLLPPDGEAWTQSLDLLIERLRHTTALPEGDVWVVGGGRLQQAFLDKDALDRLDLFILPEILGEGIRMIPEGALRRTLRLVAVERLGPIARLTYARSVSMSCRLHK